MSRSGPFSVGFLVNILRFIRQCYMYDSNNLRFVQNRRIRGQPVNHPIKLISFFADSFKRMFYAKFHRPYRKIIFFRWLSVCLWAGVYLQYLVFKTLGALTAALLLFLFTKKCFPPGEVSEGFCSFIQTGLKDFLGLVSASAVVIVISALIYGIGFYILRYVFLKVLCPHCGNRFFLKGWRDMPARLSLQAPAGWRCVNCRIPVGFDFENRPFKPPKESGVFLKEKFVEWALYGVLIFTFSLFLEYFLASKELLS